MRPSVAETSMGDILKTLPLSLLAVSVLLVTACGGPAEQTAEPSSSPSRSAAASSNKAAVPLLTTCMSLFGEGTISLAIESAQFLADVESIDADTAKTAGAFAARFRDVAETAKPELAEPLNEMQDHFEDFVKAWKNSGTWSVGESFAAAKSTVVDTCRAELDAADKAVSGAAPAVTDDEKFLAALQAAHPSMESTDTVNQLTVARIFCDLYDTAVSKGTEKEAAIASEGLVTAPAGIEYTHEELKSIRKIGVATFCPQHLPLVP